MTSIINPYIDEVAEILSAQAEMKTDGTWTTRIQGEIEPGNANFPAKIYTHVAHNAAGTSIPA